MKSSSTLLDTEDRVKYYWLPLAHRAEPISAKSDRVIIWLGRLYYSACQSTECLVWIAEAPSVPGCVSSLLTMVLGEVKKGDWVKPTTGAVLMAVWGWRAAASKR